MKCPKCNKDIEINEDNFECDRSGSGPNYEFGVTEYWWSGKATCIECGHIFDYSDSSL